jgi:hypothetical protein
MGIQAMNQSAALSSGNPCIDISRRSTALTPGDDLHGRACADAAAIANVVLLLGHEIVVPDDASVKPTQSRSPIPDP